MTSALPPILRDIKLVIWDLDDTLWSGILSEGAVRFSEHNEGLVRRLAHNGIVNSICSNNDFSQAAETLQGRGLWDYFVLPKISWERKSALVAEIVAEAQIRPEQVLLIDDNARIRAEVAEHTRVATVDSDVLPSWDPQAIPLTDPGLERLQQYRLLERKQSARREDAGQSDEAFLRSSQIQLAIEPAAPLLDRLHELIGRTNQLNYTKKRIGRDELLRLLADEAFDCGAVRVRDRFGDYGVVGFFARERAGGRLAHFLFSCRVLNMGVERFVHDHLGQPALEVVPPVAVDFRAGGPADWISWLGEERPQREAPAARACRVLGLGGCDLLAVGHYLRQVPDVSIDWDVFSVQDGAQQYARCGLNVLRAALSGEGWETMLRVPWIGGHTHDLRSPDYDVLLLSLWVDYACFHYRHKESGLLVPSYESLTAETSPELWNKRWGPSTTDRAWFLQSFEPAPPTSPEQLVDHLRWLRRSLPPGQRLVLLNGAEIGQSWSYPFGQRQLDRHREMNRAVDQAREELGFDLIDLRTLATRAEDVTNMMTHYSRRVYHQMAARIREILGSGSSRGAAAAVPRTGSARPCAGPGSPGETWSRC